MKYAIGKEGMLSSIHLLSDLAEKIPEESAAHTQQSSALDRGIIYTVFVRAVKLLKSSNVIVGIEPEVNQIIPCDFGFMA